MYAVCCMVYDEHMTLHDEGGSDLKTSVIEFVTRLQNIEAEMGELRDRKKELVQDFEGKFDQKTLRLALRVAKAKSEVAHQWEFEQMLEILEKDIAVLP